MLVEAEQRRYPGFAAERPMTNQVASAPASSREVPDGLDWHTFSAASFPGRRRHDLQAVIAYGAYRRSYAVDEHTPETPPGSWPSAARWPRPRSRNGKTKAALPSELLFGHVDAIPAWTIRLTLGVRPLRIAGVH